VKCWRRFYWAFLPILVAKASRHSLPEDISAAKLSWGERAAGACCRLLETHTIFVRL